ncbi:hypothetical protein RhiirC2_368219 [Rhizophagus irregularis]|uniref:Uncharacterized protein n=1 Tax=Rhizophagus irregularis TaxID=588596 RepID=A0A2N1NFZ1_9GLOM|nr:hypothetical protein RhiirC2_368219 [Rhizophagus irregularis]
MALVVIIGWVSSTRENNGLVKHIIKLTSGGENLLGTNCSMYVIRSSSTPYLRSTSLKSFLVLYEENGRSLFSLQSLANFASLFAGPPGILYLSSSSWAKSRKFWPLTSCVSKISGVFPGFSYTRSL